MRIHVMERICFFRNYEKEYLDLKNLLLRSVIEIDDIDLMKLKPCMNFVIKIKSINHRFNCILKV